MVSRGERRRGIERTLSDTVLYLLLLHQSGASLSEAVGSLANNAKFFGSAAEEFCQAVSDTACGYSMFEALERLSVTTPSEKFREFLTGYVASVKTTGSATYFLENELRTLREEKHQSQKRYLASLSVMAEMYLVLFVAAPLFFVIALMVLGLISGIDPQVSAILLFVVLPLGTVLFLLLLDSMDEKAVPYRTMNVSCLALSYQKREGGDERQKFQMLKKIDRRERRRWILKHPLEFFTEKPWAVFFLSGVAAMLSFAVPFSHSVQMSLFLLVTFVPFAFFLSRQERRRGRRESAMPDFFRRLSDTVSRGASLADAVHSIDDEKNPISPSLYRLSSDIRFGESVTSAFSRFAASMKLMSVNQAVILVNETSRFASDVSKTLSLVAAEMKERQMRQKERHSEMSLYTMVIYLGYFVYLFVIGIMLTVFLDAMALTGEFMVSSYEPILIGSIFVQAICSGISAGKMGSGSVLLGIKHACILLGIGTAVFFGMGLL